MLDESLYLSRLEMVNCDSNAASSRDKLGVSSIVSGRSYSERRCRVVRPVQYTVAPASPSHRGFRTRYRFARGRGAASVLAGKLAWRCADAEARKLSDIRVYTGGMKVVKVRRVGNSNVVSIPRELEARGYAPGTSVLVEELEGGELRIMPTEQVRDRIRGVGRSVVDEHAEALRILAEHDPGSEHAKR